MLTTIPIKRSDVQILPDEVIRLIALGQYSLYKVQVQQNPAIVYALRTGAKKIFLLKSDGEPIADDDDLDFCIVDNVEIVDAPRPSVIPNFGVPA